ncbi:MAG TPA: hypothetical protein VFL80_09755 [Thermoanaerobaculia bacterium]|nr:hypothetical protein [Thermoanaerobaculia bacterium]
MWTAKRIFTELTDPDLRRSILSDFWRHADRRSQAAAVAYLAKILHFRDGTIRKMPVERKAELLATRLGVREFDEFFEMALMHYHTHHATEMMSAFLDLWSIPHENGTIGEEAYSPPTAGQVRDAVRQLESHFDKRTMALYLASAGLLMGEGWSAGTWPVVDELAAA